RGSPGEIENRVRAPGAGGSGVLGIRCRGFGTHLGGTPRVRGPHEFASVGAVRPALGDDPGASCAPVRGTTPFDDDDATPTRGSGCDGPTRSVLLSRPGTGSAVLPSAPR